MAKKRGLSDIDSDRRNKRAPNSLTSTPVPNSREQMNPLNAGLMKLYKKNDVDRKDVNNQANAEIKGAESDPMKTPARQGRRKNISFTPQISSLSFDDVGGVDNILKEVLQMFLHFKAPFLYKELGVSPVTGILLHGPPGCGKTHIARAIAGELELPILEVAATELVGGISGESESKIREAFDAAVACGRCILFIDEIDAICPKRETTESAMMKRMVAQIIKCLDDLHVKDVEANVMVIGATNMPDFIDPALRRGLRFDRELAIGIPNELARLKILEVLCKTIKLAPGFDLHWLAHNTPGYVGSDLRTLSSMAMQSGFSRMYRKIIESVRMRSSKLAKADEKGDCLGIHGHADSQTERNSSTNSELSAVDSSINHFVTQDQNIEPGNCVVSTVNDANASVTDPVSVDRTFKQVETTPADDSLFSTVAAVHQVPTEVANAALEDLSLQEERILFKSIDLPEEEVKKLYFTIEDFKDALLKCVPSSKREGFAFVPDTTWDDIGALDHIKKELRSTIMWPVQYSKYYEENKLSSTKGVLLYGPKGCGKTLLAKAIANECSINFLSVNGPELLSMYVGESERAIRRCFERARNSAPCVIFFDEFDALCPPRSSSKDNAPVERVVNQLLTETCGLQERKQVFLVAATNRLEKIDSAMLRPGRLEKVLYVGLPAPEGRVSILRSLTKNKTQPKIDDELELETIAYDARCEDFSGADLAYLVREATKKAMEELIESSVDGAMKSLVLYKRHFDKALKVVERSFSEQDKKYFQKYSSQH